jgi:hypothetical protein
VHTSPGFFREASKKIGKGGSFMKTTKEWGKMLLAVMAAVVLAFGVVLVSCGEDDPCCTKSTWESFDGDFTKLPTCCQEAFAKSGEIIESLDLEEGDELTPDQLKKVYGCCYDAMKDFFDNQS